MGDSYTEEEVNRMLAEQRMVLRLDDYQAKLSDLVSRMDSFMRDEEFNQEKILIKITESAAERRKAEADMNKKADERHESYHRLFVKKTDLRVYAAIIIFAVTATVSFITWLGAQKSHEANDAMIEKIERVMKGAK